VSGKNNTKIKWHELVLKIADDSSVLIEQPDNLEEQPIRITLGREQALELARQISKLLAE
jgi:ABC-type phosphate transport system ATPase subunit